MSCILISVQLVKFLEKCFTIEVGPLDQMNSCYLFWISFWSIWSCLCSILSVASRIIINGVWIFDAARPRSVYSRSDSDPVAPRAVFEVLFVEEKQQQRRQPAIWRSIYFPSPTLLDARAVGPSGTAQIRTGRIALDTLKWRNLWWVVTRIVAQSPMSIPFAQSQLPRAVLPGY